MAKSREEIINLVQNLLALGDKTRNNSEAEVETALKKVQELLIKHNIDMAEVIIKDGEKVADISIGREIVFTLRRSSMSTWEKILVNIVGLATECQGYVGKKYEPLGSGRYSTINIVGFVGEEFDRSIAKELYNFLHLKIYSMSKRYPECFQQRSFMEGFCNGLYARVKEINDNTQKTEKYELACINKKSKIKDFMDTRCNFKQEKARNRNMGDFDVHAYYDGISESKKVELNMQKFLP